MQPTPIPSREPTLPQEPAEATDTYPYPAQVAAAPDGGTGSTGRRDTRAEAEARAGLLGRLAAVLAAIGVRRPVLTLDLRLAGSRILLGPGVALRARYR